MEQKENIQRPFSVDEKEYPFQDHWLERNDVALHFVDEGTGMPVLMLHGNPTWSFLYRNIIKKLSGTCRCIAPDYPGFGFSDHPLNYGYTPQEHSEWICSLVEYLNLDKFVLVIQDWGGPIGLSVAVRYSEKIAAIVLCNTWCWQPFLNARIFSWIMGGPVGKYLNLHHNFFAKKIVPYGIFHQEAKTSTILKSYTDPFPTPKTRMGTYVFPREIRKASHWLRSTENKLSILKDKPIEIVWAMKDPAFGKKYLRRWKKHFPNASIDCVEEASHYLQEDCPDHIVAAIKRLL